MQKAVNVNTEFHMIETWRRLFLKLNVFFPDFVLPFFYYKAVYAD